MIEVKITFDQQEDSSSVIVGKEITSVKGTPKEALLAKVVASTVDSVANSILIDTSAKASGIASSDNKSDFDKASKEVSDRIDEELNNM